MRTQKAVITPPLITFFGSKYAEILKYSSQISSLSSIYKILDKMAVSFSTYK